MQTLLWLLEAAAIGWLLGLRILRLRESAPAWAVALLVFGFGIPLGAGVTSTLFFLSRLFFPAIPSLSQWLEGVLLAGLIAGLSRHRASLLPKRPHGRWTTLQKALAGAWIVAILLVSYGMTWEWRANPHGNWDAFAIWNLRARYLASQGNVLDGAWTPGRVGHPEYPLLLSGFVARAWSYQGAVTQAVPITTAFLFFLALVATGTAGVAILRGPLLGFLFGLALATTPFVLREVPAQYADLPLACYFLAALIFLLMDQPIAAGLAAGMAAWTKDEGIVFLLVFLAATLLFERRSARRVLAGALPFLLIVVFFKSAFVSGIPSQASLSMHNITQRLFDASRYGFVWGSFAGFFMRKMMYAQWYHPIVPLLVLAAAFGLRPLRRDVLLTGGVAVTMLAGYFLTYIATPYDLHWHIETSLNRLVVQIWPCLVLAGFLALRPPQTLSGADDAIGTAQADPARIPEAIA